MPLDAAGHDALTCVGSLCGHLDECPSWQGADQLLAKMDTRPDARKGIPHMSRHHVQPHLTASGKYRHLAEGK